MNKLVKNILLPVITMTLVGCGAQNTPVDSSSAEAGDTTSDVLATQTIDDVLGWFGDNLFVNATYKFFDSDKQPGCSTTYTEKGTWHQYRNFTNLTPMGLVNIDATTATAKGIASTGVYTWTKGDANNPVVIGDKVGDKATYQEAYNTPSEISAAKAAYKAALVPEIATQKTGNYFLNKEGESADLLTSFAKSLGVYSTITGVEGMTLNYAKLYFGATSQTVNISIYSAKDGGYGGYETTIICNQFGTAKIANLDTYLGA